MRANDQSRRSFFSLPKLGMPKSAALLAMSMAFACAGKTSGETGGSLSSCGANCTVDQVTSSCSSTCAKMIQAGCSKESSSDCTASCVKFGNSANCPAAQQFLRCAESVTPTCSAGEPDFGPSCGAILKEANHCASGNESVVSVSPPGGSSGVPGVPIDDPTICPDIPRPTTVAGCAGGGSAPIEGVDAALQCTSSCQDGTGNVWEADCDGTTCACTYNRAHACTCVMTQTAGACPSCCPGTRSP